MKFRNKTQLGRLLELNLAFWTPDEHGKVDKDHLQFVHHLDDALIDNLELKPLGKDLVFPHLYPGKSKK